VLKDITKAEEQIRVSAEICWNLHEFLTLDYGMRTPMAIILAHAVFGTILDASYSLCIMTAERQY
jgi:hypothetical protein